MKPIRIARLRRHSGDGPPVDPIALAIYNKIVAWWEHDETTGTVMVDKHTGGHDGAYSGSITLNQAALAAGLAPCARFTANTSVGSVLHDAALDPGATYALMAWFKREGAQVANAKIFWKPINASEGRGPYYLQYTAASGKLLFRFNSGGNYYDITGATTIADGTVYQAICNKYTTGSELFVNNASDGTQASGGVPDIAGGNPVFHGNAGSADGFVGYYGALVHFSSPLTEDERDFLWNGGDGIDHAGVAAAAGH